MASSGKESFDIDSKPIQVKDSTQQRKVITESMEEMRMHTEMMMIKTVNMIKRAYKRFYNRKHNKLNNVLKSKLASIYNKNAIRVVADLIKQKQKK